jgi:imidazolonepropionase
MSTGTRLFTGSGRLLMPELYDGALPWGILVREGRIERVGARVDLPDADDTVDVGEALVTPGLVDAHTHPVFAGDRSDEAAARLAGARYDGGGILRTVAATRSAQDAELEALVEERLRAGLAAGTTTIECKSGYGLTTSEELRALRIMGRVAKRLPVTVIRTFLGAHAIPTEAGSSAEYAALVVDEMLPAVATERLADFCDVFCDAGFFTLSDAERILRAAAEHGIGIRMHADQLQRTGATELGVRLGAASVDHL